MNEQEIHGPQSEPVFVSPAPQPAAPSAPVIHRVGTFTLGLSMVGVGILTILALVFETFPIMTLLKFSPVILIVLGGEILFYAFFKRKGRLKYDGLSIFICLILISGTLLTSALMPIAQKTSERFAALAVQNNVANRELTDKINGLSSVESASFYLKGEGMYCNPFLDEPDSSLLTRNIHVFLNNQSSKDTFADASMLVLDTLMTTEYFANSCVSISANQETDGEVYSLQVWLPEGADYIKNDLLHRMNSDPNSHSYGD